MKNIIITLLILFIAGILWIGSGVLTFSGEGYVEQEHIDRAKPLSGDLDLHFVMNEFAPAYEF